MKYWMPDVTVTYPNGGEVWYLVPNSWPGSPSQSVLCEALGMNAQCQYPINWTATNKIGPDMDLLIDIYYSVDSGASWMVASPVVTGVSNNGEYRWRIPFDASYITENGRVKVVATHKDYPFLTDFDISDNDFCPPMIGSEDEAIALLASLNNVSINTELNILQSGNIEVPIENSAVSEDFSEDSFEGEPVGGEISIIETTTTEATTTDEEEIIINEATTTEEIMTIEATTETSGETTEDIIEGVVNEIVVDEVVILDPEPEPEPEPEQIEEVPDLLEPEPIIIEINEVEDNSNENGDE